MALRTQWVIRLSVALFVGLATTFALSWFLDGWLVPALAGGLLTPLVFLGSFFLWSADVAPTPENPQGYEQVLFDAPNNVASASMLVLMVALAFFARFDGAGADDPSAFLAQQETLATDVIALHDAFVASLDAYDKGELSAADFQGALASDREAARALSADAELLEPPTAYTASAEELATAAGELWGAMESMDLCLSGIANHCQSTVNRLAESETALAAWDLMQAQ